MPDISTGDLHNHHAHVPVRKAQFAQAEIFQDCVVLAVTGLEQCLTRRCPVVSATILVDILAESYQLVNETIDFDNLPPSSQPPGPGKTVPPGLQFWRTRALAALAGQPAVSFPAGAIHHIGPSFGTTRRVGTQFQSTEYSWRIFILG